jgi:CDP-glucose 4,6-dehydratase
MDYSESLKFYKGKNIFITGHTGFKGSWLCKILNELGANVHGYAQDGSEGGLFNILKLSEDIKHTVGDIRDRASLNDAIKNSNADVVFHLAAQALVRKSYEDPLETISTNIMGSANLLEAVRNNSRIKSLVYITSDKCYENKEWVWGYRETDELGGRDPYSASKAAAEIIYSAYQRSYFADKPNLRAASARAGNVIGGGDWAADRIVPDCVRAKLRGEAISLRNPLATRPWQHVLEPLSGYLVLGERLSTQSGFEGAWNFGPMCSEIRTVEFVARSIASILGGGDIEKNGENSGMHEAGLLQLNCDKANQKLRWMPRWTVVETLEKTGEWYKAWLEGDDMKIKTVAQIKEYFKELT